MVFIRENHHFVVVVHVAEDELQVLLLASYQLLTHLKGLLLLLLRHGMVYLLAITVVYSIYRITASLDLDYV